MKQAKIEYVTTLNMQPKLKEFETKTVAIIEKISYLVWSTAIVRVEGKPTGHSSIFPASASIEILIIWKVCL